MMSGGARRSRCLSGAPATGPHFERPSQWSAKSAALVATVAQEGNQDDAVWRLAAGGFRDTSRLAGSDLKMMGDILSTNTRAVARILALFRRELAMIEAMLIMQDDVKLAELLSPAREARLAWMQRVEAAKNGSGK